MSLESIINQRETERSKKRNMAIILTHCHSPLCYTLSTPMDSDSFILGVSHLLCGTERHTALRVAAGLLLL